MKRVFLGLLASLLFLTACEEKTMPTWQEQYDLGMRYLSEGSYEEAIIAFTAAIEIDPMRAPAYVGRGDAYIDSGETEENFAAALADYEQALTLDDSIETAYLGIAGIYVHQGEREKALEILRAGLEKVGNSAAIAEWLSELEAEDSSPEISIAGEDRSEMARLLQEGGGEELFSIEEFSFYGADYHGLTLENAEMILNQNGLKTYSSDDNSITGSKSKSIEPNAPDLYQCINVSHENGIVTHWYCFKTYREDGITPLNTGLRNICIKDSLETVLRKLGFTNAQEIAQLAKDYYIQEFAQREDIKVGLAGWGFGYIDDTEWREGVPFFSLDFAEPSTVAAGKNKLENGHFKMDGVAFNVHLGYTRENDVYIRFEFEADQLISVFVSPD